MTQLSTTALKYLRGLGHKLKPVVRVGQQGVSDAVIKELELALTHHELLKIKVAGAGKQERAVSIAEMCQRTQAECVQTIGSVALLYRPNPKDPVIDLPS